VARNLLVGRQPLSPITRRRRRRSGLFAAAIGFVAMMVAQVLVGVASGFAAPAVVEAPVPANALANPVVGLTEVSCSASTFCAAIGTYFAAAGSEGLIETYRSGTWSAIEAPLPANAGSTPKVTIGAVSCRSTTFCVAVGHYVDANGAAELLFDTMNGTKWTASTQTSLPGPDATLAAISCTAVEQCVAVGVYDGDGSINTGLIDTLTGKTWTAISAPNPASTTVPAAQLTDVSCPETGSCVAIGSYDSSATNGPQGLLERLSDGTWSPSIAPMPANAYSSPSPTVISVSCWAPGSCVTAGWYQALVGTDITDDGVIDTLKAGRWTAAVGPVPAGADSVPGAQIRTVTCPAASACVAAGTYRDSAGNQRGFVATRSQQGWSAVETPVGIVGSLADAQASACIHSLVCTAVGTYYEPISGVSGLAVEPMVEALSGPRWVTMQDLVPDNAAAAAQERLNATSCARAASGPCATVGGYVDAAGDVEGVLIALGQ
jgi:hypothetical protein